jgi:succinate dehydrogenase subunit D
MSWEHGPEPDAAEPFWWGLFAAGGGITALFTPAHLLLHRLSPKALATSSSTRVRLLAAYPLVRLYLVALTTLSFFHWAHRFRYYLLDFGVMGARRLVATQCYGSAIVGTLGAARTLVRLPARDA